MKTEQITIADHWDPEGNINAYSNAAAEFNTWQKHAEQSPDWTGSEFSLDTFEAYIEGLKV